MNNEERILELLLQQGEKLDKLDTRMSRVEDDLAGVKDDLAGVKLRLDLDIVKRLDALSEGQEVIEQRLDTLDEGLSQVKTLAEGTRDKVDVIHAVVSQHSADIVELKTVQ